MNKLTMIVNRWKIPLFSALILFSSLFLVNPPVSAQEKPMSVGLGLGLMTMPQDADFEADGVPLDLYFDWDIDSEWLRFRAGLNVSAAKDEFGVYNKTWEATLATNTLYAAYRYSTEVIDNLKAFGVGGLALLLSSLKLNNGVSSQSSSTIGYLIGGGAVYSLGDFGVGGQLVLLSGDQEFDGTTISAGFTQIQVTGSYSF